MNVPAAEYVCVVELPLPFVPSPKLQLYVSVWPSGSLAATLSVTGWPVLAGFGFAVAADEIAGGLFCVGLSLYVAVTVVLAAGMEIVVVAAYLFATVAPVHWSNTCPAGAALAVMVTEVPDA